MNQLDNGILFEDSYLGVTVGALIFSHGAILVDAPLRIEDSRSWRSVLVNQRSGSNRLLVSLDAHPDRTLGARSMDCTIIAHQKAAQIFRTRPAIFKGQSVETGAFWETYPEAIGFRWASPDITFSDRMSIHWGGPEVILEHRPGPTPGSIWLSVPDIKVVYVGDTVVLNQPPFLGQADLKNWIENLDLLTNSYHNFIIISGRGGVVKIEEIRKFIKMLKDVHSKLNSLSSKNVIPEATQELIPSLLSHYNSGKLRELFATRLRYGLQQCFIRQFRPSGMIHSPETEFEEQ